MKKLGALLVLFSLCVVSVGCGDKKEKEAKPAADTKAPAADTKAPAADTKAPAADTKAPAADGEGE
jgi:hypothetical protein